MKKIEHWYEVKLRRGVIFFPNYPCNHMAQQSEYNTRTPSGVYGVRTHIAKKELYNVREKVVG